MLKVRDLRNSFTDYFKSKNHKIVPSSSLIPKDDPTLLFTTAGMVQFKPMFAGTVELEYTRAASIQKCLRTSDLEQVGRTKRHLTFFEMLGNFSFGDYFKKEAIEFGWEFSTEIIGFEPEKIWISIYHDDDEAFEIWNKGIGIPAEKIIRLGKEDNFWGPAGDTGACGPCSELHYDRGPEHGCGSPDCKPGCDCDRYLEYWNLVFNQFNQNEQGQLTPLPRTGIDTGMGLERLATLIQGVDSVYETDELQNLINFVSKESGKPYEGKNMLPIKVMVEHGRTLTFAMSDGIYPSNEGRGYVLRRVLRRALRYSRLLGLKEPFVYKIVDPIVEQMGQFYPEITESVTNIKKVIESEEQRFLETIENGMDRIEEQMKAIKSKNEGVFPGKEAFTLYDTFGFPLEMTTEMAQEQGLEVDIQGFEAAMEEQRERGKKSWKGAELSLEKAFDEISSTFGTTEFLGYEEDRCHATVKSLYRNAEKTESLKAGDQGLLVLDRTPFYGESGGQVGDIGEIKVDDAIFKVSDTKKINKTVIHIGEVVGGSISLGDKALAEIDSKNRNLIRANHTVTHLLQAALRQVLGEHVKQAGSIVEADRMRFDFSHFQAMTEEEIAEVEKLVNDKIWENIEVETEIMNIDDAVKKGAMAVFDEKYEDIVRVVNVPGFSMELCGGTHVSNTGKVGLFKIIREASPGAGIRRIEAITLRGVMERLNKQEKIVKDLEKATSTADEDLVKKVKELIQSNRQLEKELSRMKKESLTSGVDNLLKDAPEIGGIKVVSLVMDEGDVKAMRDLSDKIREKDPNVVVLLGAKTKGKAMLLYAGTKNSVEKGIDCGQLVKETVSIVGGGGGGRKDMAQAGGKNPEGLNEAIEKARELACEALK